VVFRMPPRLRQLSGPPSATAGKTLPWISRMPVVRLEPPAHLNAKCPLPKSHCVAAFGMTVVTCRTTSSPCQIRPVV
jgi:hypothetical protein